jgi:hypothetical protein
MLIRSRCCPCVCLCVRMCIPLMDARQRLGKNPLIVARQRLGRYVTSVTNIHGKLDKFAITRFLFSNVL